MAKKLTKKTTIVREHPMHVPVSQQNPDGITIRDSHVRRLVGTYLGPTEIKSIFKNYDKRGIVYPEKGKLSQSNSDQYDETIAVWCDYFNKQFSASSPLEPNVVKALISSESDFREDPPGNPKAIGIAQITPKTYEIVQDPNGEVSEFIFKDIRKKDLKDPSIAIPIAVRWLSRKKRLAEGKLGRAVTAEEIILEYKGLLKSKTEYKDNALAKFRSDYEKLIKK